MHTPPCEIGRFIPPDQALSTQYSVNITYWKSAKHTSNPLSIWLLQLFKI